MGLDILRDTAVPGQGRRAEALLLRGRVLAWGLVAALGLAGCAAARAPSDAETQAGEAAVPVSQVLAKANANAGVIAPDVPTYVPPVVPPAARQAVVDAYDAVQKRRWGDLARLVPVAAADPVLGQYPRYWLLRNQVQNRTLPVPDAEVRQFLVDNPGTYLEDRLRADWIIALVRAGNYEQARRIAVPSRPSSSLQCALLLARHMADKRVKAVEVIDAFAPNPDCWGLLDQAANDHVLSRNELNALLRNTMESGRANEINRMAAVVFDDDAMVQFAALMKNPRKWLESRSQPRPGTDTELAAIALSRLARSDDRLEAAKYVQDQWAARMPKADMEWVWGQFGLVAALNVAPDAARWYRQSGPVPMTDYNHAWQVRAELRAAPIQWNRVADAIRKMTSLQADEPVWRYWYGRALAAQGNGKAAQQYFQSIRSDLGFYGQLAAEELGGLPSLPPQPAPLDPAWVAQARSNPGLQRAVALFDQGWRREAVPEWSFALRGMSDTQLRGAAEFARNEHIYDRVVNTSLLTKNEIDFSQRFIAPFEGRVAAQARQINLDPAWVYGLIRQESRFITDARSRVGASGLMQLMPATAKHVAKKIGMKDFKPSQVNDFDTNTVLGTSYMDMVLQGLGGSQLLATAGYNAGPGRPKRWRSQLQAPVEGAIFAETIPFTETRLYVKNVMSNAVWYSMLFNGRPESLKARLGMVNP
ncbi:transglycosylase SLT domain-containing protein [Castellaniella sp.]|uniref:lytic transglycosylase domain-containing protein n=1 Tax=Castellaniella sp. TaxID=1955812 RepID=UPI002AFF5A19|nr:transglycosylase SLT domain-containing protein [Castellaniella sp.]